MSAIHTGSITVRVRGGRLEFTGTSHDHAVTGWPEVGPAQAPELRIPAQRTGTAYDAVVLNPGEEAR